MPTPPPDDEAAADEDPTGAKAAELQRQTNLKRKWEEDVYLDFEGFDSNVVRAQLLLNSNERERGRYAEQKVRILETAQAVRDRNAGLREQLKAAQRTLEVRKGYDELAQKITNNRNLRPRDEQHVQLEKLDAEIAELEAESQEYAKTWAERREQFGKIVEEGMQMLRLIRDEKEEAERKEGMEEISPGGTSQVATPAGGGTPPHITETTDKSSSPHGSKLKDEVVGVDAGHTQESQLKAEAVGVDAGHTQESQSMDVEML